MPKNKTGQKWYYDACALDHDKNTYKEVFRGNKNCVEALASNLSIGEAYGNTYRKKGKDAAEAFMNLVQSLNQLKAFKIVDHAGIDKLFTHIRDETSLSIPDAMHLATAIKNKCCNLRTSDSDLYNIPKSRLKNITKKFNTPYCSVTKMH